jgi:hypothetical protein
LLFLFKSLLFFLLCTVVVVAAAAAAAAAAVCADAHVREVNATQQLWLKRFAYDADLQDVSSSHTSDSRVSEIRRKSIGHFAFHTDVSAN